MKRIGLFLIIMLCVSACSTAQPAPTSTSPPLAERSPTMAADPAETSDALPLFTITFDGSGCASEVPEKLPLGKYSFLVVNNTDTELPLLIALLPEGVTFQDLLDKQSEPGEYVYPIYGLRTPIKLAQNWDDSLGGKFYTFSFYEEGEYSQALGGIYHGCALVLCPVSCHCGFNGRLGNRRPNQCVPAPIYIMGEKINTKAPISKREMGAFVHRKVFVRGANLKPTLTSLFVYDINTLIKYSLLSRETEGPAR